MAVLSFLVLSYSLLAVPGPTNTLLATSAAGVGVYRSLHLLGAELCGYVGAIVVLRTALGPTMADVPIIGIILRAAVTIYILCLAGMLWSRRSRELRDGPSVTFGHVLLTTLMNPKALIFAFLLLPLQAGPFELLPWLAVLAGQIVTAGAAWLALGATLGRGARRLGHPDLINRLGAIALVAVAGLIWVHSLGSA